VTSTIPDQSTFPSFTDVQAKPLAPNRSNSLASAKATGQATYTNPLPIAAADPFVLRHDDLYYMYATSATSEGFAVWTSTDLVHWESRGMAFRRTKLSWGREHFWAPCVIAHDGAFYLFYNAVGRVAKGRTSHRICVARSDTPAGPFHDVRTPLFDPGCAVIDAHVLVDDDGRAYLYYSLDCSENSKSEIYAVELAPDLLSVIGQPVRCAGPSQRWEGRTWNEAAFVFKWDGTYILMYSGRGFFDPLYAVGFATSESPMGPWSKFVANPVLHRTDDVSGPGHNCVIASPDGSELFAVYHVHRTPKGGGDRLIALDRMNVWRDSSGQVKLTVAGPTHTPQALPSQGVLSQN